jgi:hypothetical protein
MEQTRNKRNNTMEVDLMSLLDDDQLEEYRPEQERADILYWLNGLSNKVIDGIVANGIVDILDWKVLNVSTTLIM